MKAQSSRLLRIKGETEVGAFNFFTAPPLLHMLVGSHVVNRRTKRILVVDDDPDIRQVLLDRMSSFGYVVETATDGRDALDAVQRGRFDGMLLDMLMPGIGGLEVLRRTRVSHPDLPVVVVTALSVQ
ncbi:MAG: response regulator, partial [Chloroflexi bacterium]